MPKNTKKAERAAQAKERRSIRCKLRTQKALKNGKRGSVKTHPHRRTSALR